MARPQRRVLSVTILQGDALEQLTLLPAESVDCVITSPPYFQLRSYLPDGDPDKHRELGLESSLSKWLDNQMRVFDEVKRVLKKRGTAWINLGDSYWSPRYNGGQGKTSALNSKRGQRAFRDAQPHKNTRDRTFKEKERMGIPHRFVFAMQERGWYWRDEVIWHKDNCMPESTRDRTTKAHEFLFLFSKSRRYHWDRDAMLEAAAGDENANGFRGGSYTDGRPGARLVRGNYRRPNGRVASPHGRGFARRAEGAPALRKPVAGWADGRGESAGAHDPAAHARARKDAGRGDQGLKRSTKFHREAGWRAQEQPLTRNVRSVWKLPTQPYKGAHFATFPTWLIERPLLASCPPGGVVLDPFGGVGTVGLVADRMRRNAVLIELNRASVREAVARLEAESPLLADIEVRT